MRKITFIKKYKQHKKGMTALIGNNEAHALIELGVAKIKSFLKPVKDKMVRRKRIK